MNQLIYLENTIERYNKKCSALDKLNYEAITKNALMHCIPHSAVYLVVDVPNITEKFLNKIKSN